MKASCRLILQASVLFVFLGLSMPRAALGEASKNRGSTLRIGVSEEFQSLNPILAHRVVNNYLSPLVSHTLIRQTAQGNYAPALIEKLPETRTGGASLGLAIDFPVVTLTIKEQARWGDGSPITGWDVLFTWLYVKKLDRRAHAYSSVVDVVVSQRNPRTFQMVMQPRVENTLRALAAMHVVPRHAERFLVGLPRSSEKAFEAFSHYHRRADDPALFNGPYVVEKFSYGEGIVLRKNRYFYGEDNQIPRIEILFVPNTKVLQNYLVEGVIDMIASNSMTNREVDEFTQALQKSKSTAKAYRRSGQVFEQLVFRLNSPRVKLAPVRRALAMALDLESLAMKFAPTGETQPMAATLMGVRSGLASRGGLPTIEFRPAEALRLLAENGWNKNSKGRLVSNKPNKRPLVLGLAVNREHRDRVEIARWIKDRWGRLGIETNIEYFSSEDYFGRVLPEGGFSDMALVAERHPGAKSGKVVRWLSGIIYPVSSKFHTPLIYRKAADRLQKTFETTWTYDHLRVQKIVEEYCLFLPIYPILRRTENTFFASSNYLIAAPLDSFAPETHEVEKWRKITL